MSLVMKKLSDPDLNGAYLARRMGMSRMHLHRYLKRYYGKSATTVIQEMRIRRGEELLLGSGLSVRRIALLVGFRDPDYFSRIFKAYRGMTPREFRRREDE